MTDFESTMTTDSERRQRLTSNDGRRHDDVDVVITDGRCDRDHGRERDHSPVWKSDINDHASQ